jgi:hypothetical protein
LPEPERRDLAILLAPRNHVLAAAEARGQRARGLVNPVWGEIGVGG